MLVLNIAFKTKFNSLKDLKMWIFAFQANRADFLPVEAFGAPFLPDAQKAWPPPRG